MFMSYVQRKSFTSYKDANYSKLFFMLTSSEENELDIYSIML